VRKERKDLPELVDFELKLTEVNSKDFLFTSFFSRESVVLFPTFSEQQRDSTKPNASLSNSRESYESERKDEDAWRIE
jgi:hypothetical protein